MKATWLAFGAAAVAAAVCFEASAQETVRVGVLQGYSGLSSTDGAQTDGMIKLMTKKFGDSPSGKKIEFVRRDTTGPNPEVAKRLAQEVITREGVQILIGPDFTANTLAVAPIVMEAKVPSFVNGAATTGIVGEKSRYSSRTFFAAPQLCRPLAAYAVKNNWKRIFVAVADFAPGHDCEKFFLEALSAASGTLVGQLRIPLVNPEFSGYMQRIRDAKPDAFFIFMPTGELSIGMLRALNDSGLKATGLKIMGTGDMTDEPYLDAVGDAALGTITASIYSTQHNSAVNKEFVKEYYELNGTKPRIGMVGVAAWDALRLTYDALNAQAGSKFDPDKFVAFVHGRSFESPRGPVTIDRSNGDIIQNVYIDKTEKVNGVLQNIETETVENVSFK